MSIWYDEGFSWSVRQALFVCMGHFTLQQVELSVLLSLLPVEAADVWRQIWNPTFNTTVTLTEYVSSESGGKNMQQFL